MNGVHDPGMLPVIIRNLVGEYVWDQPGWMYSDEIRFWIEYGMWRQL